MCFPVDEAVADGEFNQKNLSVETYVKRLSNKKKERGREKLGKQLKQRDRKVIGKRDQDRERKKGRIRISEI